MLKVPENFVDPKNYIDNPNWTFVNPIIEKTKKLNPHECYLFEEKGVKEERTLIIKIYGWYTTVFINKDRNQYLLTLRYQEELDLFVKIMENEESILDIIMDKTKTTRKFLKEKIDSEKK